MKKAAIYTRVSTNYQVDKDSLPLQKQDMINYAKYALNIDEYEVFEDAGFSGKNTKRPAFQDMIKRIKKGEFTHLLVWKIDRISRNLIDFCEMYDELKKYNCTFVSKNEQFDTSSAMGETMLKIILVFAELERKLTAERVTAVMFDRASKGLWNGAPVPLGYRWDKETKFPVIDEEESRTIEFIFNKYKFLKSCTLVRNVLNETGLKTKRGGTWTTKTISDIIRNPFYKGTYRYNYRKAGRGERKKEEEWIVKDDNHDKIIDKELWETCNQIMNANTGKKSTFKRNSKTHVFSTLVKCGECSNTFHAKEDKKGKDGYIPTLYICSGRYNHLGCNQKTISDKIVGTFVMNFIKNIDTLKCTDTIEEIENKLLKGACFKKAQIDDISIKKIKNLLLRKEKNLFRSDIGEEVTGINNYEMVTLEKEKVKFERALSRLDDLYLFDDASISEKEYLSKKIEIKTKIKNIDDKMNIYAENVDSDSDITILVKEMIFKLNLFKSEEIDYKTLVSEVGKKFLKDVINTMINEVVVMNRDILEIKFKNGLSVHFIYSS
ncbi:MAG: recombinase family protein [Clostridium sp.]